jgi:ferredoxin
MNEAALRAEARALGFDAVRFTQALLPPEARARLDAFVDSGAHGGMAWMEVRRAERAQPRQLWPEAVSVIVLGTNYGPGYDPLASLGEPGRATISCYAQGRDYHDVVKKQLKALARWMVQHFRGSELKVFVDTAPVMEKPLAQQAGLGWQGKHTNLLSRDWGNWLFLGEIYTTLALTPDQPEADHCGSCRACLDACPTAAFPAPYRLDARRCISYLTIEHRGPIRTNSAPPWATASMAATTAWPPAPGTSSPAPATRRSSSQRGEWRPRWGSWPRLTTRPSASASPARRSSASAGTGWRATSRSRSATAATLRCGPRPGISPAMRMRWWPRRGAGRWSGWRDRGRARPAVWRPGQRHLPRLGAASLRARRDARASTTASATASSWNAAPCCAPAWRRRRSARTTCSTSACSGG